MHQTSSKLFEIIKMVNLFIIYKNEVENNFMTFTPLEPLWPTDPIKPTDPIQIFLRAYWSDPKSFSDVPTPAQDLPFLC